MRPCFLTAFSAASIAFPCFDGDEFAVNEARRGVLPRAVLPGSEELDYNRHILPNGGGDPVEVTRSEVKETVSVPVSVEVTMSRSPERPAGSRPNLTSADSSTVTGRNGSVETRAEKLERIRREIELGIYDTPERFEAAFERMLEKVSV